MGHVTRFPGDALTHPIDATPFATYVDDLAAELGSYGIVAARMKCGESWLLKGAFRTLGVIERDRALECLENAGAEVWAIYPQEVDVPLEDDAYCGRCHENVTPIDGACPWCESAVERDSKRVKGYCSSCDEMVTPANNGDCWRCGTELGEQPWEPCKCDCGTMKSRFDPQGRRTAGYLRGHAPQGKNPGTVPAMPFRRWLEDRLANLDVVSALARECGVKRETIVAALQAQEGDEMEREVVRRALWVSGRSGSKGKGAPPRPDAKGFFDLYPEDKRSRTCPGCGEGKAPHAEMCKACRRKAGGPRPTVIARISEDVITEGYRIYRDEGESILTCAERLYERTALRNVESLAAGLSREWKRRGWEMRDRTRRAA